MLDAESMITFLFMSVVLFECFNLFVPLVETPYIASLFVSTMYSSPIGRRDARKGRLYLCHLHIEHSTQLRFRAQS